MMPALAIWMSCRTVVVGTPRITHVDTGTWGPQVDTLQRGLSFRVTMPEYGTDTVTITRTDTWDAVNLTLDTYGDTLWSPDPCVDLKKTIPLTVSLDGTHTWPFEVYYAGYEAPVGGVTAANMLSGAVVSCGSIRPGEVRTIGLTSPPTAVYAVHIDAPLTVRAWAVEQPEKAVTLVPSTYRTDGTITFWEQSAQFQVELTYDGPEAAVGYVFETYNLAEDVL